MHFQESPIFLLNNKLLKRNSKYLQVYNMVSKFSVLFQYEYRMKLFRKLKLYLDPIRFQYLKLCPVKLSKGTFVLSNYLFRTTLELGTVIICTYLLSDNV